MMHDYRLREEDPEEDFTWEDVIKNVLGGVAIAIVLYFYLVVMFCL